MRLVGFGLQIDLDEGWEGRLFRRPMRRDDEVTHPVLHLANFPLPDDRADFGGGVVEHLRSGDCFAVLFDYGPEAADQPLFAHEGIPRLGPRHFSSARLQRSLPGQVGAQLFFRADGHGWCLYVVLGSGRDLEPIAALNSMMARTKVVP